MSRRGDAAGDARCDARSSASLAAARARAAAAVVAAAAASRASALAAAAAAAAVLDMERCDACDARSSEDESPRASGARPCRRRERGRKPPAWDMLMRGALRL